jgi:hypothetical protein
MAKPKVNKEWNGSDNEPKAPKLAADTAPVKLYLTWEGTQGTARKLGALLKRIVADLENEPEARRLALALRKCWREATEEAGVRDG